MKKYPLLLLSLVFLYPSVSWGQTTLVIWDFDSSSNVATGGTDGSGLTPNNLAQTIIHNVGGTLSYTIVSGSNLAFSSNKWSLDLFDVFTVNTTNYTNLTLSFKVFSSATGPRDFKISYSTNGASGSFTDISGATFVSPNASWTSLSFGLPSNCDQQADVAIRFTCTSAVAANGGAIGSTGSFKVDNLKVESSLISPLPVELTSFTNFVTGNKVILNWRTATEVNNYGFEVQRFAGNGQQSAGGSETGNGKGERFEKIGFVQGNGNSNSPKNYSFTDEPRGGKEFQYRLKQIDFDGQFEYSDVITATLDNLNKFTLQQNYPNPFNPVTRISYTIPERAEVKLKVYDMLAQEVAELASGSHEAGHYQVTFDGSNLPSGAYFYKLDAGKYVEVKKLLLVK